MNEQKKAEMKTQIRLERAIIEYSEKANNCKQRLELNNNDAENWINFGLSLREQLLCREAIEVYSEGICKFPFNAMLYRHRGHAYVNVREYALGAADFEFALRLDPENWDCLYHLGLAYFLSRKFKKAKEIYERCIEKSKTGDKLVPATDWYYMTLLSLGDFEGAKNVASRISKETNPGENIGYHERILGYNGILNLDEIVEKAELLEDHMYATHTFGVAYHYLYHGKKEKAIKIFKRIGERDSQYTGFAEHAAYETLKYIENNKI